MAIYPDLLLAKGLTKMVTELPWRLDENGGQIFLHFQVDEHYLNLNTFILTADSARKIVRALDRALFSGELALEVIVLPPRDGSFLTRLAVMLGGTGTFLLGAGQIVEKAREFVESDVGSAYVEGLTGKAPEDWARDLGEAHRQALQEPEAPSPVGLPVPSEEAADYGEGPADVRSVICEPVVQLLTSMTRGILEMDTNALEGIGMQLGELPEAMEARADFYQACYSDRDVKRVGFTPDEEFPVPRTSFPERAQKPVRKKKDEEEPEWLVAEDLVRVDSPTWDQDKQRSRKWLGVDQQSRSRYFVIDDAEFWGRIRKKELQFEGSDRLVVQWAYQIIGGKAKNRRVLRVLEFNGRKLAEPLSSDAIAAMLGSFSTVETSRSAPSLLDFMDE